MCYSLSISIGAIHCYLKLSLFQPIMTPGAFGIEWELVRQINYGMSQFPVTCRNKWSVQPNKL